MHEDSIDNLRTYFSWHWADAERAKSQDRSYAAIIVGFHQACDLRDLYALQFEKDLESVTNRSPIWLHRGDAVILTSHFPTAEQEVTALVDYFRKHQAVKLALGAVAYVTGKPIPLDEQFAARSVDCALENLSRARGQLRMNPNKPHSFVVTELPDLLIPELQRPPAA